MLLNQHAGGVTFKVMGRDHTFLIGTDDWANILECPVEDREQVAIEVLADAGLVDFSEVTNDWLWIDTQRAVEEEYLNECAANYEHIRQESRSDLFI